MIIFINKPKPFEAAVILRTLYYSTLFSNIKVYINGKLDKSALLRYSRVPIYEFKKNVKFDIPVLDRAVYINPMAEKSLFDLETIPQNIVIDFSGEYKEKFEEVSALGLNILSYEAVAALYYLFIRKIKKNIPNLRNTLDRDSVYIAKKLLLFLDSQFPNEKKLKYILQHVHKKWKITVDIRDYKIYGDYRNYNAEYKVEFFDKTLRKITDASLTIHNDLFRVPILRKNILEYREFYLDKDRRRVWITQSFYVSEKEDKPDVESFFNLFSF